MAIVPLQKIRVFTPISDAERLVGVLQDVGCMEIIPDTSSTLDTASVQDRHALEVHHTYAEIEMARTFFSRYHQEGFLRTVLEGARAYTSLAELERLAKDPSIDTIVSLVEQYQTQLATLDRDEHRVTEELHTLFAWDRFDLPLNSITETALTITYALRGPERSLKSVLAELSHKLDPLLEIKEISVTTALITFLKDSRATAEETISTGGVEVVKLPESDRTATSLLTQLQEEHRQLAHARIELTETIRHSATEHLPLLQKLSDLARWQLEKIDTVAGVLKTDRIAVITAWAPKERLNAITDKINAAVPVNAIEQLDHTETETVPSGLENKSWLQPFESVTHLYGSPFYRDLDPTPALSLFFFIFFGFCLSDAGYGLILMLLTGLLLWRYHLDPDTKRMITLLFYGGVSTVLAGALFGGYFGISPADLAATFPALDFLVAFQYYDPINDPMPVFFLALILGFIHLAFGVFLNMQRKIGLGETKSAVLDEGPWLYFFLLVAVYLANNAGFLRENISQFLSANTAYLFGSAVLLIVATQGRSQKNPIMKLLSGILGLYGAVGYFADILSYSRLMALGLSTGALAFSINSIAAFVGGDSLGIGTVMMIVVLIFGHTLNLAISTLGTFINSARLQFVEFFSKFSTGSGRPFVPFRKEPRHIIILPDPPPQ